MAIFDRFRASAENWSVVAKAWLAVLLPFILIPLPHYIHDRKHIFGYIYDILFGTFEQSYALQGTRSQHMLYFLTGPRRHDHAGE